MTELFIIDGVETMEKEDICILKVPLPFAGSLDRIYDLITEYINTNEGIYLGSKRVKC